MFTTFEYRDSKIFIGTKLWSDFAAHIPLIRSFSFGSNFPPEYPIFPNFPIHYHFLFYFFVGMLEKSGIRLDIALNTLSTISFFLLLVIIFKLSHLIFKNTSVAYFSVIFFLFNGSLSFIEFFKLNALTNFPLSIITNSNFPSWGPYDGKIVSAFWNLNVYTNQRHLAISFFLALLAFYFLLKKEINKEDLSYRVSALVGVGTGFCYFLNQSVFLMFVVLLIGLLILFKRNRGKIITILIAATIVSLPQYLYVNSSGSAFSVTPKFGYLISSELTFPNFLRYWILNLGFNVITIPLALYFATKLQRKVFLLFFSFFIVGNVLSFTPDVAANHKFFNFFMIVGSMFSALAIIKIWQRKYLQPLAVILFLLLTFSGIIELFPIFNDKKLVINDYPKSESVLWIKNNTEKTSIFLNTSFLYDDASIAGRKIFLGWPYFPWSAGYNTDKRALNIKKFFHLKGAREICSFLEKNNINYVSLTSPSEYFPFDKKFWMQSFESKFHNDRVTIFSRGDVCKT